MSAAPLRKKLKGAKTKQASLFKGCKDCHQTTDHEIRLELICEGCFKKRVNQAIEISK